MKTRTNISNVRVWVVRLFLTVLLIFTTATILRSVTVSDLSGQHKNSQVKAPSGPSGNFGLLPDGPPVPQRAAISAMRGHHWIIENNRIEWCNAEGIDLGSQDFAADRSSRGEGHSK